MKLYIMFGQRKERYEYEYAPEALMVWDEYSIDENSEGFEEACVNTRKLYEKDMMGMQVLCITVDQETVRKLLIETPEIHSKLMDS